jgi:RNA-directed DNA polymerase
MKRVGNLWSRLTAFDNLYLAYRKARRGKGDRLEVATFDAQLEKQLFALRADLLEGRYQPGDYRLFTVYERKPRQIAAAPFRDRVVHHALMNLLEPAIDPRFIFDSYACRKGKGVHQAVARYQYWAQRYRYALKLDISRYFPSIDHAILKGQLRRVIKDVAVLDLLDRIIDGGPATNPPPRYFSGDDLWTPVERRVGIPIGNLTSQFFANLYLNGLDHFIKERLQAPAYLRYVDDMILLADDKAQLWAWREAIVAELGTLRLLMHPKKCHLAPTCDGLDVLGYRVFPGHRLLRNDNGHRFARKLSGMARAYAAGCYEFADFRPSIMSWIGHAGQADTLGLRKAIFGKVSFARDQAERQPARESRGFVEQQWQQDAFRQPQQQHP